MRERVRYPTIFPKSLIRYLMTGDGIVANRCSIEMLGSLARLCDYQPTRIQEDVRGRRLALGSTALRSPPMHRRTALKSKSLDLLIKRARVLRRSGVMDSSPLMAFEERHLGRDRCSKVPISRKSIISAQLQTILSQKILTL